MDLGRQWNDRLRIWAEELPRHYYQPWAPLPVSFFTTMERLPFDRAVKGRFEAAPEGTRWGGKWEYGWFHAHIVLPGALAGKRVVLTLAAAPELLVWVNGREAGSIDRQHRFITLSRCARAGDAFDIYAEGYAGHGVRNEGAGPVAWGTDPVPEPPERQTEVGPSSFGVWNETLFQASMDYLTLYSLLGRLPERSLRAMRVAEGLKRFTCAADLELPEPELTESVAAAGRYLKPLLACRNGSTAPEFTVFGQSHLDLAWLWPVEESIRKSARTYANQLALAEEYPEYRFLLCEPPIPEWLRGSYPEVYRRVREGIASGQFCPEGAVWVEADMNIPSGESLIRQFVRGKRWFRAELGVESRLAWMPDTFGFPAALPQIMKKCGVPYFAAQKLTRQDPEAEPFPCNLFWWEGMDGSRVLAHIYKKNNAVFQPGDVVDRWEKDRVQQSGIDGMLYPFGYGDGGGGPTREMVETALRCADLEGMPRCRMEDPVRFFERQDRVENTYRGELYLSWHRGTLTSQARTKRGIRKAEIALKQAEYAMSLLLLAGKPVERRWRDGLERLWELLLFNQFHDIAAGASIARVHERAEAELEEVAGRGAALIREMLGAPGERTVVWNPLGWPRRYRGAEIPAQGWAVLDPGQSAPRAACVEPAEGGAYRLRNGRLTCLIDGRGQLLSARTPSGREFMAGAGNRLLLFKDVNTCYDAWELGSMYESLPVPLEGEARARPFTDGEGAGVVVERTVGGSRLTQRILLGHQADRLDFITEVDWQERHRLLKAAFPVNVYAGEAIHEIQFGYVRRPTHRSRRYDRDRYEVCSHRYTALEDGGGGAAVLNDCKYGVNVVGNEIRLTLLKAAMMPDKNADRGLQRFTYAFCPFEGPFGESGVVREAAELNEPPMTGGALPVAGPVFLPHESNILVDTVKPADTAANALLVRAYECMGRRTDASFTVSARVKRIEETDMLEENGRALDLAGGLRRPFGAFEIKTFLLYLAEENTETDTPGGS